MKTLYIAIGSRAAKRNRSEWIDDIIHKLLKQLNKNIIKDQNIVYFDKYYGNFLHILKNNDPIIMNIAGSIIHYNNTFSNFSRMFTEEEAYRIALSMEYRLRCLEDHEIEDLVHYINNKQ